MKVIMNPNDKFTVVNLQNDDRESYQYGLEFTFAIYYHDEPLPMDEIWSIERAVTNFVRYKVWSELRDLAYAGDVYKFYL